MIYLTISYKGFFQNNLELVLNRTLSKAVDYNDALALQAINGVQVCLIKCKIVNVLYYWKFFYLIINHRQFFAVVDLLDQSITQIQLFHHHAIKIKMFHILYTPMVVLKQF